METEATPHPDRLVLLTTFPSSAEAGMVHEILLNNGIDSLLQGANFSGLEPLRLPGGFSEVRLLVPYCQVEAALLLYRAFFEPDSTSAPGLSALTTDEVDGNEEGDGSE